MKGAKYRIVMQLRGGIWCYALQERLLGVLWMEIDWSACLSTVEYQLRALTRATDTPRYFDAGGNRL